LFVSIEQCIVDWKATCRTSLENIDTEDQESGQDLVYE
jgi:hypothetical protein